MSALLLDTNVVSIVFNRNHSLRDRCIQTLAGHQLAISFMTRAELLLWPAVNNWGQTRRSDLVRHLSLYTTLFAEERTCEIWVEIMDRCRRAGLRIQTADAWIAAIAKQWGLPLVTTDYRDFEAIDDLQLVPIGAGS